MPLVYQKNINSTTKVGVWHIVEDEAFFLQQVPLQREITHPHKRLQHLAGRFLLKELFPDFPYELIRIASTRKPFLENDVYHFSISHCGDYAAVIVSSNHRVGVDIELPSEKLEKVQHKFLSDEEALTILSRNQVDNPRSTLDLLTIAWSVKESMFKWYGIGKVDFKEHMQIDAFSLFNDKGVAHCRFLKEMNKSLIVHSLFLNENCVTWVMTEH
jgi:phosphopantetheinyl transferase